MQLHTLWVSLFMDPVFVDVLVCWNVLRTTKSIGTRCLFRVLHSRAEQWYPWGSQCLCVPSWERRQRNSTFLFQPSYYKRFLSQCICCVFFLVLFLFKMLPSMVLTLCCLKPTKAVMHYLEKIHVWDAIPSGFSYAAVGCEISVNEPAICME